MKEITVLMVEDNRGDVVLMQEAINSAGLPYKLNVASDGMEALDYLLGRGRFADAPRPDLIVLDLKLPGKTGIEVLDEIQPDPVLNDIPMVILSSSKTELRTAGLRRDPPYSCIAKPNTFEGYVELVRNIEKIRQMQRKEDEQWQ